MPIFAISDLHLCDRGPRDNFAFNGREERFYNFLKMVEEAKSRLLILGDLFDFWQVNMGASINAYLPLLDRLAGIGSNLDRGQPRQRPGSADRLEADARPPAVPAVLPSV